jgi:hypothetical protein
MIDREIKNEKMKRGVSRMLVDSRKAHEAMAREARMDRAKFVSDLAADVRALTDRFSKELARTTAEGRQARKDFDARLKKAVENLRGDTLRMMKDHRESLAEMQVTSKVEREAFITSLRNDVTSMQHAFHQFQRNLGKRQRNDLQGFVTDLKQTVDSLVSGLASDRAGARDAWLGSSGQERKSGVHTTPKAKTDDDIAAGNDVQSAAAEKGDGEAGHEAGMQQGDAKEGVGGMESVSRDDSPGKGRKKGKK